MYTADSVSWEPDILKSSKRLLKVRVWFNVGILVQIIYVGLNTLTIDTDSSSEPEVRMYGRVRWKLITCWFNLLLGVYAIVALYCDWKETKGEDAESLVKKMQWYRNVLMTSILFPTTMFSDTFFWRLWYKDPHLIAPPAALPYLPFMMQHCLHTLTMANVLADLALVPRRRPRHMLQRWGITVAFLTVYLSVAIHSRYVREETVYPFVDVFNGFGKLVLMFWSYIEHSFYFTVQWPLIELIWGADEQKKKQ